jgi:hypothetical protein
MNLITDGAKLTKFIDEVCEAHKAVEGRVHIAACSALYHANEHRNADMMIRLMTGLGGSVRRNALIEWCIAFGKLEATKDGKGVQFAEKELAEKAQEAAQDKPFWEFKPEAPFQAFDLMAEIAKLVKRSEKAAAANDDRNKVPAKELMALRTVLLVDPLAGVA